MVKIVLKGNPAYLKRMYKHLRKEHPSTIGKIHLIGQKGGKHR